MWLRQSGRISHCWCRGVTGSARGDVFSFGFLKNLRNASLTRVMTVGNKFTEAAIDSGEYLPSCSCVVDRNEQKIDGSHPPPCV